ncbi:MAG: DNA polymerase III, subunit gamma and tau [Candidatus Doudnabacteria bacterium RIFCSPHIGHO2_01_FULL_50_11]|uniref:DNA polymerase III subunit gamma/tau n=1 Tax=Candidatus Doudnabacteria bacterium RIFCSPHIGHO2_01_FULL_50_11 TaxID=1817828 RepID=A0A1F5PHY3_9BACT|nr:MAG: DNA polymerase III, subunit gamma and tau [Candidatus Doudnabacteria bacterium RIFCSPHIGHO2_01_FULL_50_11]
MGEVLYRQYRPQTFSEVINQDPIKRTLKNAVEAGNIAHAYLFTGPRGVGKTSLARILAKAANCLKLKGGEPCDACDNCVAIREGRFLDLIEIDAASNTGVDNIREIIEHVKFSPSSGKKKIIVIDEVHMLSKGAFNALLKTLEEPPAHAVFILATTELQKVPATIVSRTQRFDFRRLASSDIVPHLTAIAKKLKYRIADEALILVARASEGSLRDALSLLDQLASFTDGRATLEDAEDILGLPPFGMTQDFFDALITGGEAKSFAHVDSLIDRGFDMAQVISSLLQYLQMVASCKIQGAGQMESGLTPEDASRLREHASSATHEQLRRLLGRFIEAAEQMRYSKIPELPMQLAVMDFFAELQPQPSSTPSRAIPKADTRNIATTQNKRGRPAPQGALLDMREEIVGKWNELLEKMREYNHSLISSLRLASVIACDGETVTISFPYKFHKEAVEQRKNKLVVEAVMEEVYGRAFRLLCLVSAGGLDQKREATAEPRVVEVASSLGRADSLLDEAMKVFGKAEKPT